MRPSDDRASRRGGDLVEADGQAEGLEALRERTGADELMLSTRAHAYDARVQSLRLVAGVTDQQPVPAAAG